MLAQHGEQRCAWDPFAPIPVEVERDLGRSREPPRDLAAPAGSRNCATSEVTYSAEQLEFLRALERYQHASRRRFPSFTEVLAVLLSLGYRKVAEPGPLPVFHRDHDGFHPPVALPQLHTLRQPPRPRIVLAPEQIAGYVDGSRTVAEIATAAGCSRARVYDLLQEAGAGEQKRQRNMPPVAGGPAT